MSGITKFLGGMMKGFKRRNFVIENLFGDVKTRQKRNGETRGPRNLKPPLFQSHSQKSADLVEIKSKRYLPPSKIAKKIFKRRYEMDKFLPQLQDDEPKRLYPEDFQGAAPGDGVIYISSDEDEAMECGSFSSFYDLLSSSEDETEEIATMALHVETQMSELIAIPVGPPSSSRKCGETKKSNMPPFPTFDQSYFSLGRGNGHLKADGRIKRNHPINLCRNLSPHVDTPLSPPDVDRGLIYPISTSSSAYASDAPTVESMANHFNDMELEGSATQTTYSDCVICGKPTAQIREEAVNDYLDKTVVVGETLAETQARKRAFLDGMTAGTFLLMPGGVSRAAACDGNYYTISYSCYQDLPGTLPLN